MNVVLVDYHLEDNMLNPPHPGESVRDCMEEAGWTAEVCAGHLGVILASLSQLLNGHTVISPEFARRLEALGWSNAAFWLRLQEQYDQSQLHREAVAQGARGQPR